MLEKLKNMLSASPDAGARESTPDTDERLRLAAAALMVEAARMDENFDETERARILRLVREHFGLDDQAANELVALAESKVEDSVQLFGFTRLINSGMEHEERVQLLQMVWEVVYSDGEVHDHEANLMRRLAGLLHITDQENGSARRRARERIGQ